MSFSVSPETDIRAELTRVFDLCHGCRLCLSLCPSFPTLFDAIDNHDGAVEQLSESEQDQVVDECYQCKLCYNKCPYTPPHEWNIDFPRLMLGAATMLKKKRGRIKAKVSDQVFGRTDLVGKVSSGLAPLVNAMNAKAGSLPRKAMDATLGIASERLLPLYSKVRFSSWFKKHSGRLQRPFQGKAALFPTCLVEYQAPQVGKALVGVYEKNGVECSLPAGLRCCGAPWLHSGNQAQFKKQAKTNVAALIDWVRTGHKVVVPEPTCSFVLKNDYPEVLGTEEAREVAANTFDASEFLWNLHKDPQSEFDTHFEGQVPQKIAYHAPCHLRAQNIGLRSRDLLKLTGAEVTAIQKCSGIDGTWGLRSENYSLARRVAQPLKEALENSDAEVICGDCHLANGAIAQETGAVSCHPLEILAKAYGIESEDK